MTIAITPSDQACGANVTGVDLSQPLDAATIADIRAAWLEHHVLAFPGQRMSDDDLERFTGYFGGFGDDPFIRPIPGRRHIIAVRRRADETTPIFAENWHSDWSFQARPPSGTCLYGITIPPVGGNTEFSNQHAALDAMPDAMRRRIEGVQAIHSARGPYAPAGVYGEQDAKGGRSMEIVPSEEALATQLHPLIARHPETGREGLFGCPGYIVGFAGMDNAEAYPLMAELIAWQGREEFRYSHKWEAGTLVMWDNRSVLHRATGGFDGYDRLLHRTTIAAWDEAS
jgi:taurine dioxygenase